MKLFTSKSQKIGEIGENVACKFLEKHGYRVTERNYTKKYGEIDIVAKKASMLYFVEVKTVSCEIINGELTETAIRPEENMHTKKFSRFKNTVLAYLLNNKIDEDISWQIDLICVYLDLARNKARITRIENLS